MKNFSRALREAWRYWLPLIAGIMCSIAMAALWGGNIVVLFPAIETMVQGDNLQTWNEKRIAASRENVRNLEAENEAIILPTNTDDSYRKLRIKKDLLKAKLQAEQINLVSRESLQPWLHKWLPSTPFHTVLLVLALLVVGTILKQVFGMANAVLVSYVSQNIAREIRLQVFSKALTLDRQGFNTLGASGFTATITQTTNVLAQGITSFYGGFLTEPLRIFSCVILALLVSWRVTLASMILAPVMVVSMIWLNRKIRGLAKQALDRSLGFHHVMLEVFNARGTVQAYTMEEFERERFHKASKQMRRMGILAGFYNSLANPITECFGIAALCTGLGTAAYLVITHETHILGIRMTSQPMTVTELTVVFGLLVGATEPLRKLSGAIAGINSGTAAADLLYPLLDKQTLIVDSPHPKQLSGRHQAIEFENVTFSYDGKHNVLTNINLSIPFGERLAVVGPNGGGKSTLMNLVCRFFDPQQGQVMFDGVSLKDLALNDIRRRIAIVSQQSEFFNETILHNIRYGRWEATDDEVIEAAKKAKAHDFISGFAQGYQTRVGPNGQRLSGGQRQRIALARALLRNSEILILDEATNQIDVESERLIHEALLCHARDRTLIMITHRQSTLALATRVVQIDRGAVTVVDREAQPQAA